MSTFRQTSHFRDGTQRLEELWAALQSGQLDVWLNVTRDALRGGRHLLWEFIPADFFAKTYVWGAADQFALFKQYGEMFYEHFALQTSACWSRVLPRYTNYIVPNAALREAILATVSFLQLIEAPQTDLVTAVQLLAETVYHYQGR